MKPNKPQMKAASIATGQPRRTEQVTQIMTRSAASQNKINSLLKRFNRKEDGGWSMRTELSPIRIECPGVRQVIRTTRSPRLDGSGLPNIVAGRVASVTRFSTTEKGSELYTWLRASSL